jgi:hypothetical protein
MSTAADRHVDKSAALDTAVRLHGDPARTSGWHVDCIAGLRASSMTTVHWIRIRQPLPDRLLEGKLGV